MSNFFVKLLEDESIALTVPGYVVSAVLLFAALILGAKIASRGKPVTAKKLAFSAAAIALAMVTSMIKLFHLPMGGSVTLFSMLFVTLIGYWYGPVVGLMAGVAYGLLQFIIDPYIVSLPQVLVDYIFAFGALGISGFFSKRKHGILIGYISGCLGRFAFAVLSGVIFFGQWAPEDMGPWKYSIAYNGTYIGAEAALTVVVLLIPAVSRALELIKRQAVE